MQAFQSRQPLLKPYVKHMVHMTLRPQELSSVVDIPTGNVFLSLFLGNTSCVFQSSGIQEQTEGNIYMASRQLEMAQLSIEEGEMNVIGIKLPANAIHQLFGIPQHEITNRILKLEDLLGAQASSIYQQIINETDVSKQLAMVEHFLCRRILSKRWKENASIDEAVHLICQSKGKLSIPDLAKALRISTRSLERKFLEAIGISPKAYCNVIRFNHAFTQLTLYKKHMLDVVAEAGYYDQPHFLSHFRKVFGISPGRMLEEQDQFLYFFRQEAAQQGMPSLVHTLCEMRKLYLF